METYDQPSRYCYPALLTAWSIPVCYILLTCAVYLGLPKSNLQIGLYALGWLGWISVMVHPFFREKDREEKWFVRAPLQHLSHRLGGYATLLLTVTVTAMMVSQVYILLQHRGHNISGT